MIKNKSKYLIIYIIVCSLFLMMSVINVSAATKKMDIIRYEFDEDANYSVGGGKRLSDNENYNYGAKSLGSLSLEGNLTVEKKYNDYNAYAATGNLSIRYSPAISDYKTSNKENWTLIDSDAENINGVDLGGDIDLGAILVEISSDGEKWSECTPVRDIFDKNVSELTNVYTITESDIRAGRYYRVSIAYEMKRKTGANSILGHEIKNKYETKRFMEVYKFYVGYGDDPLSFRDIENENLGNSSTFRNGFSVSKGGTSFDISVSINNGKARSVADNEVFTTPGLYKFTVRSELGEEYTPTISVTEGLSTKLLFPKVYENGNKGEYTTKGYNVNIGMASYGMDSLSSVFIGQDSEKNLVTSKNQGVDAFGINGQKLCTLYMCVENLKNGYEVIDDNWGTDKEEKVMDAKVGKVGTGVLLIQKSFDNINWRKIDSDCYAEGLHTNDFSEHYAGKGYYRIYSPSGAEMQKGLFLRITYAYNVNVKGTKKNNRCVEVYNLYLCSNDLEAVTFHNLTLENKGVVEKNTITENEGDKEINIADYELHKGAETLLSGSSTVTGFKIDTSMNPTVGITVMKDGKELPIPDDKKFEETGKYTVKLTSKVGSTRELILYVDRRSVEEILKGYFGSGFIRGKRIYDESKSVPVFEGGETTYFLEKTDTKFRAIKGTLTNANTKKSNSIFQSNENKKGNLTEAGYYSAVFTTKPDDKDYPGDYLKISFQFYLIEKGTAPGPKKNQELLEEYSLQNISDFYPMYYGVTEKVKGNDITVAFSNRVDAEKFAFMLEWNNVDTQPDGTYRYSENKGAQKNTYYDNIAVTAAVNEAAEKRVQILFFDLSKQFTYQTVSDKYIENLNDFYSLDLHNSIVVAGESQRKKMAEIGKYNSWLISPKPCSYADKNTDATISYNDFKFVSDTNCYDSYSFNIFDKEEKIYNIGYGKEVGAALQEQECKSGVVTIHEITKFKDETAYNATFIAKNDNTSTLALSYSVGDSEKRLSFNQDNHYSLDNLEIDYFVLNSLSDKLDPYSIVRVTNTDKSGEKPFYAVSDQLNNSNQPIFASKGKYEVAVINRLGYSFKFNVNVSGAREIILDFQGEGENISTAYGAKNVRLPKLTKTGYILEGFKDENGDVYSEEIAEILYKGNTVLNAVWKAKEYKLTLLNPDESPYDNLTIAYDEEKQLPTPSFDDGTEFVCWMNNGTPIEGNIFTLKTESDITLTATVKDKVETITEDNSTENLTNQPIIPIITGVFAFGILGLLVVRKKKKR